MAQTSLFAPPSTARRALFSMLNPSTADAFEDDPTARRCRGFAAREGCTLSTGVVMGAAFDSQPFTLARCRYQLERETFSIVNPYAFRSPEPLDLVRAQRAGTDIIGAGNDAWIEREAVRAHLIIVASGNPPSGLAGFAERMREVARILSADGTRELLCFGLTKAGWPKHPLYLPGNTPLVRWEWR